MTDFETRLLINGEFVAGEGPVEPAYEPALGTVLAEVASASAAQIDAAVVGGPCRLQVLVAAHPARSGPLRCWRSQQPSKERADSSRAH